MRKNNGFVASAYRQLRQALGKAKNGEWLDIERIIES
jgi:hypothetical protein